MGILGWIGEMFTGSASGGGGNEGNSGWHDIPAINSGPDDGPERWAKADRDHERYERHGK